MLLLTVFYYIGFINLICGILNDYYTLYHVIYFSSISYEIIDI